MGGDAVVVGLAPPSGRGSGAWARRCQRAAGAAEGARRGVLGAWAAWAAVWLPAL